MPIYLTAIDYAALILYTVYLGGVLGGIWAILKTSGKQRFWGLALTLESAAAVILLTLMSSKYWFSGAEGVVGIAVAPLISAVTQVSLPLLFGAAIVIGVAYLAIVLTKRNYSIMSFALPCLVIPIIFAVSTPQLIAITERNKPAVQETTQEIKIAPGFR